MARETDSYITAENSRLQSYIDELKSPVIVSEGANHEILKKAKTFFDPQGKYEIQDGAGSSEMTTLFKHLEKNPPRHKVVFVWDPDYTSANNLKGNAAILPIVLQADKTNVAAKQARGIESVFPKDVFLDSDYTQSEKTEDKLPGESASVKSLDKKAFFLRICKGGTKDDFKNFEPAFKKISAFFK